MILSCHIKKSIVYAFLCIYSFALIKPAMPLVSDVIAHTFYKMQHMATVHYENGKYHVHAELAAEATGQKDPKSAIPAGIYETLASHVSTTTAALFYPEKNSRLPITFPYVQHPLDAHIQNPVPPPEA